MKLDSLYKKLILGLLSVIMLTFFFTYLLKVNDEENIFHGITEYSNEVIIVSLIMTITILSIVITLIIFYLNQSNETKRNASPYELYFTNSIHSGFVNFYLDHNFEIIYASNGFYDIIGYSKEEIKQDFDNRIISFVLSDDYDKFLTLREGLENGDYIQRDVRMVTKEGKTVWILLNGNFIIDKYGKDTISAVLVDITESKKMHERLLLEEERYRVAAEISNDILFEYEINEDVMEYVDKYKDLYGREPIISNFATNVSQNEEIIHPEDLGVFSEYCRALRSGKEMIESEFRICDVKNKYIWCHIRGKTIYDDNKNPIRVIGKLVNIDLHKKELETLEYKAKRDPLTGVYNKVTTMDLIDHFIQKHSENEHIFMIIDIDDFKKINDKFGHLQGDRILSFVISQVKMIFTGGEIIGRIGGDEFVVFVGDIGNLDTVIMKAKLLQRALRTVYCEEEYEISVSGSIGISSYPKDGKNYNQLLNCADKALYDVKEQGKDGYKLFT